MGSLYPAAPIALCVAVFGLLSRHALEMRTKKNYREMWGAWTLSVLPASLFCLYFASTGISDMMARNWLLIPAGAVAGACVFAYAGHFWHDTVARAQSPSAEPVQATQPGQSADVINGPGIITHNQSGGTNQIINQEIPARVEFLGPPEKIVSEGQVTFVYRINVTKPVSNFQLQAEGDNVNNIHVSQDGPTSAITNIQTFAFKSSSGISGHEESFGPAFGRYIVTVSTSDESQPKLTYKID